MRHKFYFTILILAVISTFAFYKHPTINFGQKNTIEIPSDTITNRDILAAIQNNTFTDPVDSGFDNIYGLITIALAALAFIVSIFTFWAQLNTEEHTKNAPYKAQEGILHDMPRHIYRNLVCTLSIINKFEKNRRDHKKNPATILRYPSESNVLKLQTMPEEVILKIDLGGNDNGHIEKKMHETSLLIRNYNLEVQVAADHFSRKGIDYESLRTDYDNLLFKPFFLLNACYKLSESFRKNLKGCRKEPLTPLLIMSIILAEHIDKGVALKEQKTKVPSKLIGEKFPLTSFGIPDIKDEQGDNPIERSFYLLFGINKEKREKEFLKIKKKELLDTTAKFTKDKNFESFKNAIATNSIYGDVLNGQMKDDAMVNIWNLFKIMCYLDSTDEMKKIGMINVA